MSNIHSTMRRSAAILTQLLTVILLASIAGCGLPQPMGRPMPPFGQPMPIGYPVPQPIVQPNPLPIGQPISQPKTNVFAINGTQDQQATLRTALARCTFPFERLRPGLQREGRGSVRLFWEPMSNGTLGWASTNGEVAIKEDLQGLQAQRTAILEIGHIVDFFYLTPDMRKEIIRLWHPDTSDDHQWFDSAKYWDRNGEAYSVLFLWAFTDEEMWFDAGYSHKPSKELAGKLRAVMLPAVAMNPQKYGQYRPANRSALFVANLNGGYPIIPCYAPDPGIQFRAKPLFYPQR